MLFRDIDTTILDDIKKIYFDKFSKLSDKDYQEIYQDCVDRHPVLINFNESTLRKNIKAMYDYILDNPNIDISKQATELHYYKTQYAQLKRKDNYYNIIQDQITEQLSNIKIKDKQIIKKLPKNKSIPTIFLSDIHIGLYEYSIHENIFDNLAKSIINEVDDVCDFVFTGDIIENILRLSNLVQLKMDITSEVINAIELIINLFETIINNKITIRNVYFLIDDNHGQIRVLNSKRNEYNDNYNHLISYSLKNYCARKGINYIAEFDNFYININGTDFRITHGHQFKGEKALHQYYLTENIIYGHFHNFKYIDDDRIIISLPSLISNTDYQKSLGFAYNLDCKYVILDKGFTKCVSV